MRGRGQQWISSRESYISCRWLVHQLDSSVPQHYRDRSHAASTAAIRDSSAKTQGEDEGAIRIGCEQPRSVPVACATVTPRHVLLIRRDVNRRGSSLPSSKDALHRILRAPTVCTRARCGSMSAAILLSCHCRLVSRRVSLALLPSDASPASGQSSLKMLLHSQFTGSRDGYQSFIEGWDDAVWLHWFGEGQHQEDRDAEFGSRWPHVQVGRGSAPPAKQQDAFTHSTQSSVCASNTAAKTFIAHSTVIIECRAGVHERGPQRCSPRCSLKSRQSPRFLTPDCGAQPLSVPMEKTGTRNEMRRCYSNYRDRAPMSS